MATTLLELRDACKSESDNVNQSFVADSEWNTFIGKSYQELYGIIVTAFGNDYFTQSPSSGYTFTTDGTNQFFDLPADFFKLLGVDVQVPSPQQWMALEPFPFSERNSFTGFVQPTPQAGQSIRVFYVPTATVPTDDADTIDGVNGWEEYIIVDACIKALAKEESDQSSFFMRKQALLKRVTEEVDNRDAGGAIRIADTRGRSVRAMRYRLNGNKLWLIGNSMPGWSPFVGDWGSLGEGWWY